MVCESLVTAPNHHILVKTSVRQNRETASAGTHLIAFHFTWNPLTPCFTLYYFQGRATPCRSREAKEQNRLKTCITAPSGVPDCPLQALQAGRGGAGRAGCCGGRRNPTIAGLEIHTLTWRQTF